MNNILSDLTLYRSIGLVMLIGLIIALSCRLAQFGKACRSAKLR